jgi:hypothetical protein
MRITGRRRLASAPVPAPSASVVVPTRGRPGYRVDALLAECGVDGRDWVLIVDDDVVLPAGFLDRFLCVAERGGRCTAGGRPSRRRESSSPGGPTSTATRRARCGRCSANGAARQESLAGVIHHLGDDA